MKKLIEEWRAIEGVPNYEVSSFGRVRSLSRTFINKRGMPHSVKGRILRQGKNGSGGYLSVRISIFQEGVCRTFCVHHLVTAAFHGPKPSNAYWCAHWDGDKYNNKASNLRWATPKENRADTKRHGTFNAPPRYVGVEHPRAKLSEEQVKTIRQLCDAGMEYVEIALRYPVDKSTIGAVCRRTIWKHVQ